MNRLLLKTTPFLVIAFFLWSSLTQAQNATTKALKPKTIKKKDRVGSASTDIVDFAVDRVIFDYTIKDADLDSTLYPKISVKNISPDPEIVEDLVDGQKPTKLKLPINQIYEVSISQPSYRDTTYTINLTQVLAYENDVRIFLKPNKRLVNIEIKDIDTDLDIPTTALLRNRNRNETISLNEKDQFNGKFRAMLRVGDDYELQVSQTSNYFFQNEIIVIKNEEDFAQLKMVKLVVNSKIELYGISFPQNSYTLDKTHTEELDRIFEMLVSNKTLILEVAAHTDSDGSDESNMTLSNNRAQVVYEYLTRKGMPGSRLIAKGYGSTMPLVENDTVEHKTQNRRFELIVRAI